LQAGMPKGINTAPLTTDWNTLPQPVVSLNAKTRIEQNIEDDPLDFHISSFLIIMKNGKYAYVYYEPQTVNFVRIWVLIICSCGYDTLLYCI
jgi:hypothetical protein